MCEIILILLLRSNDTIAQRILSQMLQKIADSTRNIMQLCIVEFSSHANEERHPQRTARCFFLSHIVQQ